MNIVAGGGWRARCSPEYLAEVAIIRAEIEAEFEPLLAQAGLLGRLRLRLARRRRIKREIDKLLPGRALYL